MKSNFLFKLFVAILSFFIVALITLSVLGSKERVGYITDFKYIEESSGSSNLVYSMRIRYYDKVFRNSDIYGVYVATNNLPNYITSISFEKSGSPYGKVISTKEISYDERIDVGYKLKIKIKIFLIFLSILFIFVLTNYFKKIKSFTVFLVIIFLIILEILFFRNVLSKDKLFGDAGDGRLTTLTVEHWYNVVLGKESPMELISFYPAKNTISHTDLFLVFSIPFIILRFIGVNMFIAYKATLIFIHIFGTFSLFYLLYRKLKLNLFASLIGVILFSYSSLYYNATLHTQLFAMSFLPLLSIFLFNFIDYFEIKNKRIRFGILIIITIIALQYNSFYIGFFTLLFILIFLCVLITFLLYKKINFIKLSLNFLIKNKKEVLVYIIVSIIIIIPFFIIYLPTLHSQGGRNYTYITEFFVRPLFFINVSSSNLFYGHLFTGEYFTKANMFPQELQYGLPLISIFILILSIVYIKRSAMKEIENIGLKGYVRDYKFTILFLITISLLLSYLLLFKVGNFALWYFVYKFIPGGSVVAAVSRYLFFLTLPVAIIISVYLNDLNIKNSKYKYYSLLMVLSFFLLCEHFNKRGVSSFWSISSQENMILSVPKPPKECEVMYIIDNHLKPGYLVQLDSWTIANYFNLKTINGYSGGGPKNWNVHTQQETADYIKNVDYWVKINKLENVYSYNAILKIWKKHEVIKE